MFFMPESSFTIFYKRPLEFLLCIEGLMCIDVLFEVFLKYMNPVECSTYKEGLQKAILVRRPLVLQMVFFDLTVFLYGRSLKGSVVWILLL